MSSAGTLLDDLDAAPANPQDEDIVKRIMSEINAPSGGNPIQMPPAPSARAMVGGQLPPINSLTSLTMDPSPATAHMIGCLTFNIMFLISITLLTDFED